MNEERNLKLTIANRLRTAREMAGLSQSQVALKMKMHRPTISEIEAGRRNVTTTELKDFAELYDVDLNWLINNRDLDNELLDRVQLAARKLSTLDEQDLEKMIEILKALKKSDGD